MRRPRLVDARARDEDARAEGACARPRRPACSRPSRARRSGPRPGRSSSPTAAPEDDEQRARRRRRRPSPRGAPTRPRAPSRSRRRTGSRGRRPRTCTSRVVPPPGREAIAPKLTTRATSRGRRLRRPPRPPRRSASARSDEGPGCAERARSAPRRARASRRTDSRRLSVNELMATRAATPIATAATSSSPRRREARLSRQARARTKRRPGPPDASRGVAGGRRVLDDGPVAQADDAPAPAAARSGSWVTSTRVVPSSRFSSPRRAITFAPFAASRLPVGSSAKRIRGRCAKARATATRCCSPPESWAG